MKDIILTYLAGVLTFLIFNWIRSWIIKVMADKIGERFSWIKFFAGMLHIFDPVLWAKDFASIFNLRKIIIYLTVAFIILSVGYYKGKTEKPINVDLGKEVKIYIDKNEVLHITKDGEMFVEDKEGNVKKQVKVKDLPELQKKLKPFGLVIEPIFVSGMGYDVQKGKFDSEVGAGISFLKWFRWRLEAFLTNKAGYVGMSYRIKKDGNAHVGIGVGKGYNGDDRVIGYIRFKW